MASGASDAGTGCLTMSAHALRASFRGDGLLAAGLHVAECARLAPAIIGPGSHLWFVGFLDGFLGGLGGAIGRFLRTGFGPGYVLTIGGRRPVRLRFGLQSLRRVFSDIFRASGRPAIARPLACLDICGFVSQLIAIVGLKSRFDRRPIQLGKLVFADAQLAAVDIRPVDVVPLHFSVEVAIIQTIVAIDVDIAVPATTPYAPVVPIDDGGPGKPGDRSGKERGTRIVIAVVIIGIIGDRRRGIVRFIKHFRRILRDIDLLGIGRTDNDVVVFSDDRHLVIRLNDVLCHRLVAKLLDGNQHVLLLIGKRIGE